jgi:RHS repeat-associated protein
MADTFAHRFSTKYWDSEAALYYYGHRFYRPDLGRWVSRDPLGEAGGVSLSCFVSNEPLRQFDSLGLFFRHDGQYLSQMPSSWNRNLDANFGNAICVMRELLKFIESTIESGGLSGRGPGGQGFTKLQPGDQKYFRKYWDYYGRRPMEYTLANYAHRDAWTAVPGLRLVGANGANIQVVKPMIDRDYLRNKPFAAMETLIHEPQHDVGQFRIRQEDEFHDTWGTRILVILGRATEIAKNSAVNLTCCEKPPRVVRNQMDRILCKCECPDEKDWPWSQW